MNDVFVSYKSEDAARVVRLVQALEAAGLSVWWDRHLPGGESWNNQIQSALDNAKCVLVVWTRESVGPAGDFVRDEARQGKRRGVLVPIKLDPVDPPPGFGEIQAIDLTHWKGGPRDPFFQDLVAAVAARIEGRAVPPSKAPMKRLTRSLAYSGLGSALVVVVVAFGANVFRAQDRVCGIPLFQPGISDVCGALGLGSRPSKLERTAWERRQLGSCADLRTHIERFPNGSYREEAHSLLAARHVTHTEAWMATARRLVLFEPQREISSPTQTLAQTAALSDAERRAERLCRGFAAASSFRLESAKPAVQEWNCVATSKGTTCGFEGEAVCGLRELHIQEQETCGK